MKIGCIESGNVADCASEADGFEGLGGIVEIGEAEDTGGMDSSSDPSFGDPVRPAEVVAGGAVVLLSPILTHSVSSSSYLRRCSPVVACP